jgi:RNA polymerase sigma-70 factor (sigma-E family)
MASENLDDWERTRREVSDSAAPVEDEAEPLPRRDQFSKTVAAHHQQLARLAFLLCNDRQQAEDAVAEAYARVWPKFRHGAVDDLLPYLRRAVANQVRGGLRRRMLEQREVERRKVDWHDGVSPERSVDDAEIVLPALETLPQNQRAVLVLRFYEDLSEDEIAATLDIPPGTVKSRCARGLEQMRRAMGEGVDA